MSKYTALIFLILVGSLMGHSVPIRTSSVKVDVGYQWIWDEIDNTGTSDIKGDDVLSWGSSLGAYYNSSEIMNKLNNAKNHFPDLVSVFEIGKSYQNKSILAVKITAPNIRPLQVKYETVVVGNHHAREAITVIDVLLYMDRILDLYSKGDSVVTNLLEEAEVYLVPTLNPDGLDALYLNPWIRKNMQPIDDDGDNTTKDQSEIQDVNGDGYIAQYYSYEYGGSLFEGVDGPDNDTIAGEDNWGGVDLNRNYPFQFIGDGSSPNPRDMNYRGPEPLSAPETRAWVNFANNHTFFTAVSLHSGTEAIITPWSYTDKPAPDQVEFNYIVNELKKRSGFQEWSELPYSYSTNGEWGDWMYGTGSTLAVTLETYGNDAAMHNINYNGKSATVGVWDLFNPASKDMIDHSNSLIQPMIDFMVTYPSTGSNYYHKLNGFTLKGNQLTLTGQSEINNLDVVVQYRNKFQGWTDIDNTTVDSGAFNVSLSVEGFTDKDLRVFIGKGSRGLGYQFNALIEISGVPIVISYENNTLPFESGGSDYSTININYTLTSTSTTSSSSSLVTTISSIISSLIPTGESTSEKSVIGIFGILAAGVPVLFVIRKRKHS